jgi:hypothetical protein
LVQTGDFHELWQPVDEGLFTPIKIWQFPFPALPLPSLPKKPEKELNLKKNG